MTASPESSRVVTSQGREIVATFTTNGLCVAEASFGGLSLEQVGKAMEQGRAAAGAVRAIFHCLLLPGDPEITPVGAGRILGEIGLDRAAEVIQAAHGAWMAGAVAGPIAIPDADQQGRLAFEAGGVRFVLAFHFNAMAEIEPVFPGMTMPMIANDLLEGGTSVVRLRAMFRAALIDDREVSLFEAGELIDRIGLAIVAEAVGKAFIAAFPKTVEVEPEAEDDGNRKARRAAAAGKANPTKPRQRKGGTGKA